MENGTAFLNGTSPELHLTGRNGVFKCLFLSMEKKMHLFYEEMYLNLCYFFFGGGGYLYFFLSFKVLQWKLYRHFQTFKKCNISSNN